MPCTSDGYSKDRPMNKFERQTSLERHHAVVEKETEDLRKYAALLEEKLKTLKKAIPGLDINVGMTKPYQTQSWQPMTYRDPVTGKFPSDIQPHNDWLDEKNDY